MSLQSIHSTIIHVVAAIILKGNRVLIAKRQDHIHQGGLWEFPGGKIEQGETPVDALKRELKEELDLAISSPEFFQDIRFEYSDKNVHLNFYRVVDFEGEEKGNENQEIRWVDIGELKKYCFPEANQPIVNRLLQEPRTKNQEPRT